MRGITRECVVELFDRKVLYLFAAVTLMGIIVVYLFGMAEVHVEVQGDAASGQLPGFFKDPLVHILATFMSFLVFMAVMATAGLVPNMLMKGRADFYLSKPLSRSSLLLGKLLAMWSVYGGLVALCGVVAALATWLAHGFVPLGIVWAIVLKVVTLFIWLSVTVLAGVLSGSASASIMTAFIVYILQWILQSHELITGFIGQAVATYAIDLLYYVLPKANELGDMATTLATGGTVGDWMPLWSSVLLSFVLVWAAVLVFRRKDC